MNKRTLLASTLLAIVGGQAAYAQTACETYTVKRGDTLGSIASAAYGSSDKFRMIYDENRSKISDPNIISVGAQLSIPCANGATLTVAQSSSNSGGTSSAMASSSGSLVGARDDIRFVTMPSGDAPFSGVDLPKGGMISEIALRAIEIADPNQEAKVYFVGDPRAHLSTLLPLHAFDAGFTWYRPDCSANIDVLNPADKSRCTDFLASDPVYQDTVGVYALKDSPYQSATTYEDLHGAKLCRPSGYFEFDLAQAGLVDPNVEIVKLANSGECLRALKAGEVDLWSINIISGPDEIGKVGMQDEVAQIPDVEFVLNSHYLIAADHPRGQEIVDMLNTGLRKMVETGEWYEIIQWHLTDHEKRQNQ